jgi:hypothetical protein
MNKLQEFLKTHIIPDPKFSYISSYFCAFSAKLYLHSFHVIFEVSWTFYSYKFTRCLISIFLCQIMPDTLAIFMCLFEVKDKNEETKQDQ